MTDIRGLHREAISLAQQANEKLVLGDKTEYFNLTKKAFELEKQAALQLQFDFDAEPTRSVLLRSAATLAFNFGNYSEAEQLIHLALAGKPYAELKIELDALYDSIKSAVKENLTTSDALDYRYLDILKDNAVHLKVEPKNNKYSKGVLIEQITDFLKNIQNSYLGFVDVAFKKYVENHSLKNYDELAKNIRKDSNLIAVGLEFKSFGISIVSDNKIMNSELIYSKDFTAFKNELFDKYKNDVLLPEYNSEEFIENIGNKYTVEERYRIYNPIIKSISQESPYTVALANNNFTRVYKKYQAVSKISKSKILPKIKKESEEESSVLIKNIELKKGSKKSILESENLDYAEFNFVANSFTSNSKSIYFKDPYNIKIIFENGSFLINDSFFDLFIESDDFKEIKLKFGKEFISKFNSLLSLKESKQANVEELELLDHYESNTMRDW